MTTDIQQRQAVSQVEGAVAPLGRIDGPTIGAFADCTDRSMPIVELALALEERGFTGIFVNEHPHLPVAHARSTFPAGGEIPDRYARFWDPFIALSFVAAKTSLDVGTAVSLVGEHDAIALAKAVASLDVLSRGRFHLGVGYGWHREEFEDHGLPASVRAQVVEETVLLMRELWTREVAAFDGDYRHLSPSRSWPKPITRPHTPVLLGAPASERNFRRAARWADGWLPTSNPLTEPRYAGWVADIRKAWEDAGRDPTSCKITALFSLVPRKDLVPAWHFARDLGIERILVRVGEAPRSHTLNRLDELVEALHAI